MEGATLALASDHADPLLLVYRRCTARSPTDGRHASLGANADIVRQVTLLSPAGKQGFRIGDPWTQVQMAGICFTT